MEKDRVYYPDSDGVENWISHPVGQTEYWFLKTDTGWRIYGVNRFHADAFTVECALHSTENKEVTIGSKKIMTKKEQNTILHVTWSIIEYQRFLSLSPKTCSRGELERLVGVVFRQMFMRDIGDGRVNPDTAGRIKDIL